MYMHAKKSPTHVTDPVVHVEFGGLWKHQNNPAYAKNVRVLIMLKMKKARRSKSQFWNTADSDAREVTCVVRGSFYSSSCLPCTVTR